jgi:hypothetical protein
VGLKNGRDIVRGITSIITGCAVAGIRRDDVSNEDVL